MDSKTKKVAVVMPFYRETLSAYENVAITQCHKVLGAYPIIAIKPTSIALPAGVLPGIFLKTIDFDDKYFKDIAGYNALMLSADFYKTFLEYEYILVYQLDAFVFKDDLQYWCSRDYDYIGAPWLREHEYPDAIKALKSKAQYYLHTRYNIQKNGVPTFFQFENKVGNGGFSLRRIKPFYETCIKMGAQIDSYLSRTEHEYNEDMFWGIEVNRKKKILNIPRYKTGLKFSIENFPGRAMELNNNQLPFGCHAWDKHTDFWRPIFEKYGYTI